MTGEKIIDKKMDQNNLLLSTVTKTCLAVCSDQIKVTGFCTLILLEISVFVR